MKVLSDALSIPVEIHAHNDFGLASANTLAAIKAGAKAYSATIAGIGERAGNAALEEVAMALNISMVKSLLCVPTCSRFWQKFWPKLVNVLSQRKKPLWAMPFSCMNRAFMSMACSRILKITSLIHLKK